jgi:hypothetical protein
MKYFKHKYPQNTWANQICTELKILLKDLPGNASIVDAPCGSGIIASIIKQSFPDKQVFAFDLNPELLKSPYRNNQKYNAEFKVHDIFEKMVEGENNIWLFINSMYCLSDNEKLINGQKSSFKYIIAVFPDIEADNYNFFLSQNRDFRNPSAMSLNDTVDFMNDNGYHVIKRIGITKIKFHIWNRKFIFKLMPNSLRNIVFTCLDKLLLNKKPQYSLMIFKRYE